MRAVPRSTAQSLARCTWATDWWGLVVAPLQLVSTLAGVRGGGVGSGGIHPIHGRAVVCHLRARCVGAFMHVVV